MIRRFSEPAQSSSECEIVARNDSFLKCRAENSDKNVTIDTVGNICKKKTENALTTGNEVSIFGACKSQIHISLTTTTGGGRPSKRSLRFCGCLIRGKDETPISGVFFLFPFRFRIILTEVFMLMNVLNSKSWWWQTS
jgi:hypothetical protein